MSEANKPTQPTLPPVPRIVQIHALESRPAQDGGQRRTRTFAVMNDGSLWEKLDAWPSDIAPPGFIRPARKGVPDGE